MQRYSDPLISISEATSSRSKVYNVETIDPPLEEPAPSLPKTAAHKREDSTSNTQPINDSSFDISPNSSGVMLLEQITEIKRLFELQGKELENVGQVINTPNTLPERMKELIVNFNKDPSDSLMNSIYNQNSGFNFVDSRQMISPVPNNFEGTEFASSLMSLSDYAVKSVEHEDDGEPFLKWVGKKGSRLNFMQKMLLNSHVPGLRM